MSIEGLPPAEGFMRAGVFVRPWAEEEDDVLLSNPNLSIKALAEMLDRNPKSVEQRRHRLRKGPQRSFWSKDDDEFILKTPNFTGAEVAKHLGRTKTAIENRRRKLADLHGISFGTNDKKPNWIGKRRLLGKSCTKCGLILSAEWFRRDTNGNLRAECKACRPAEENRSWQSTPERRVLAAAQEAKMQAMTTPAENAGQPWLQADFDVLADPDLTLLEKALKLKRTWKATAVACSRNGYTSKRMNGLGDAATGAWHIDNPNETAA